MDFVRAWKIGGQKFRNECEARWSETIDDLNRTMRAFPIPKPKDDVDDGR